MRPLVHRGLWIDPLRVLLEPIEDERLSDEPLGDERLHVHDRGRIAEGQADLGLEVLGYREVVRAADVPIVVADRFFAEDVLAGVQRGEGELLVVLAAVLSAGHDVHDVDIRTAEDPLVVGLDFGDPELLGAHLREVAVEVAQHDDIAER